MDIGEFIDFLKDNIDAFECENLTPECDFKKLAGWDSVAMLSLMAAISANFSVQLSPQKILSIKSVQELFEIVSKWRFQ